MVMKKIFLLLPLLAGCALLNDNENCISARKFQVFQTFESGALMKECKGALSDTARCQTFDQIYFIANQEGVEYYDGMRINAPYGKCAVKDGVFKYKLALGTSRKGREIDKVAPIIRFENR